MTGRTALCRVRVKAAFTTTKSAMLGFTRNLAAAVVAFATGQYIALDRGLTMP